MILILFIGAVFVYALAFMAVLVGLMAVALSLCVYAITYIVSYAVAKIKHRASPEWKFDKRPWTPDRDLLQGIAWVAGMFSLAGMVIGFLTYALSDRDWGMTLGVPITMLVLAGVFMAKELHEEKQKEAAANPPKSSGPTF